MKTRTESILKLRSGAYLGPALAVAAILLAPARTVRAEDGPVPLLRPFSVVGSQASSSAPFLLQGDPFGDGAVWKRVANPVLGPVFGMTSSPAGGAGFQVEYSQNQIVTQDGSTITLSLYGTRSTPYNSPNAHITQAAYDIVGGTGRYQSISGAGTVTIDARADGSSYIILNGFTHCSGGMCIARN